ncbi:hydrolase [Sphingomonas sp.]|uniref:hydrolase n=1 Tax=Sphingomonas sp. TaxID=28214 RepID=UPI0035C7CBA9
MESGQEHEALIARIDAGALLARTQAWSAVNSGTRNLHGLAHVAALLGDAFSSLPGALSLVDGDGAESVGSDGVVTRLEHGQHLRLVVRPEAPVQMLFTGHMDTVYPADHAFQALTWRDENTLNGPGVTDMKGGLSVMLEALRAVEAAGTPQLGYEVVINSDEETGSFSSARLIAEAARGKHAALTYEPALPDGTLAGARGGTGNFSVVVRGRAAHAGRNPADGRNAIAAVSEIALRLHDARGPRLAVNPARIDGGGPNNVVPDLAVLRINFRPGDLGEIERARGLIAEVTGRVAERHDVRVELHGGFNRPPKPIDPGAARLFALIGQAGAVLDLDIAWRDTGGVCDGNNIAAAGVPVVDTMGVRGGAIHSSDEYLLVDSLVERAALSALTITRIAEGALL